MEIKTEFRWAAPADCALILEFIRDLAVYERMEKDVVTTREMLSKWLFEKHAAEVIFAMVDGREVGFALFFSNFSTFAGRPGLYLEDVFVKPEYRGRGIGRSIFQQLAHIAVERGYARFEWSCLDWNSPSIAFYNSLGAKSMSDWTTFRVDGDTLSELAAQVR